MGALTAAAAAFMSSGVPSGRVNLRTRDALGVVIGASPVGWEADGADTAGAAMEGGTRGRDGVDGMEDTETLDGVA